MDKTERISNESDPRLRAAAEWALELDSPDVPVERVAAWQHWLNQNPRHAEAFDRIDKLMSRAGRIRDVTWPTREQIAADEYDGSVPVSAHAKAQVPSDNGARQVPRWRAALAAGVALAIIASLLSGQPRSIHFPGLVSYDRIETRPGGTQKVVLADGSAIDVSGRSTLRATLTRSARRITLDDGEAFFRVAKDARRPFTVQAGATVVTAIGTAFNVRCSGERVVVAVAEGSVRISAPGKADVVQSAQLDAGEQAIAEHAGAHLDTVAVDARAVAGWREGRLQYLDEPLASIANDVGRYTARHIEITDPALRDLRVTGTVLESNLDGWLLSLEEAFPLTVEHRANGSIRISPKTTASKR
jgi:transmembrane sensor